MDAARIAGEIDRAMRAVPQPRTEPLRRVRRGYSKRLRDAAGADVVAVADALLGRRRWAAYELIADHPTALGTLDADAVEHLGRGIDSWWTVDAFARTISGPAWLRGLIPDEAVHRWAGSDDRWWRRAALVSTVALNMKTDGGRGDTGRTLETCRMLISDRDDMVVKALSWALRALVQWDPDAVRRFVDEHEAGLAPRVKREVRHKLDTGLKNPRRGNPEQQPGS